MSTKECYSSLTTSSNPPNPQREKVNIPYCRWRDWASECEWPMSGDVARKWSQDLNPSSAVEAYAGLQHTALLGGPTWVLVFRPLSDLCLTFCFQVTESSVPSQSNCSCKSILSFSPQFKGNKVYCTHFTDRETDTPKQSESQKVGELGSRSAVAY